MREFIPEEYRWDNYRDLKTKIVKSIDASVDWEFKRKELWSRIRMLTPEAFQQGIWLNVQKILE